MHREADTGTADLGAAWQQVCAGLRQDMGTRSYNQWFARARAIGWCPDDRAVTIALPSAFAVNWVRGNCADRLLLGWRAVMPDVRDVRIVIDSGVVQPMMIAPAAPIGEPAVVATPADARFDARMQFASFVVGDANRVACNAARAVGEGGPMQFNPLFIHSATGQGKTHLLQAIGHAYVARKPASQAIAMSAERFVIDFVNAIRAKDQIGFKSRLRSVDLLMIDDFQFIAGKGTMQEEFLHTIDELIVSGRQLVITADRSPHLLEGVEGRLLSRLTQGLVVDIKPADYALRRAIVAAKADRLEVVVPDTVLDMLASRIASSVRELEGGLNRLVAYAALNHRTIDDAFAEEVLADMFRASRRRITIDEIQKRVAEHFAIRQAEMVSARRARDVARPRQIAMYIAKQMTPRSLPEIGRRFGGRDHTTVIHAVRQIEKLRAIDTEIDRDVRALIRALES